LAVRVAISTLWIVIRHTDIDRICLQRLIKSGTIVFAGNKKLKIYGTLRCTSGKRMKVENRLFFESEEEALRLGFRRCKKCSGTI
jgi:methylphosphotriester-DNA--protein-cysteine methyltransferase